MPISINSPAKSRRSRIAGWFSRTGTRARWWTRLSLVTLVVAAVFLWERIFITIDPGHAGVYWSRFLGGTRMCETYGEGVHVIPPWDRMYVYDTRLQHFPVETVLYTQDGLELRVSGALRYRLNRPMLSYVHKELGPRYEDKLLYPEVVSTLRKVLGDFSPEEIYSKDEKGTLQKLRATIEADLADAFTAEPAEPGCQDLAEGGYVRVEDFLLLEIVLPERVEAAVQYKLEQEQYASAYQYILKRENDERARRVVEAQGIREFQEIAGIPILRWRGLEVTEKLATSSNAKVIIAGTGSDQLPLILNADAGAEKPSEAPQDAAGSAEPSATPPAPRGAPPSAPPPRE